MKVIIIEDEMLIAQATKVQLESNGFEILGIARNEEGFWDLMKKKPDAILMDIVLKDRENGVEIVRKLRESGDRTSVIFTTGNSHRHTSEEIADIPNTCIISKPVIYPQLFERIRECCSRNSF